MSNVPLAADRRVVLLPHNRQESLLLKPGTMRILDRELKGLPMKQRLVIRPHAIFEVVVDLSQDVRLLSGLQISLRSTYAQVGFDIIFFDPETGVVRLQNNGSLTFVIEAGEQINLGTLFATADRPLQGSDLAHYLRGVVTDGRPVEIATADMTGLEHDCLAMPIAGRVPQRYIPRETLRLSGLPSGVDRERLHRLAGMGADLLDSDGSNDKLAAEHDRTVVLSHTARIMLPDQSACVILYGLDEHGNRVDHVNSRLLSDMSGERRKYYHNLIVETYVTVPVRILVAPFLVI